MCGMETMLASTFFILPKNRLRPCVFFAGNFYGIGKTADAAENRFPITVVFHRHENPLFQTGRPIEALSMAAPYL